jgi:hypothetical protein
LKFLLFQPITAEEVQAAVNLTPPTNKKQLPATGLYSLKYSNN